MPADSFNLRRFENAQAPLWKEVLEELHAEKKRTHWMWFVFPQLAAIGRSQMAKHYGITSLEEAMAYMSHPVLGARLVDVCGILIPARSEAVEIFGEVDAMKLRSSLTLFAEAAPHLRVFEDCLQRFFRGEKDPLTLMLLS